MPLRLYQQPQQPEIPIPRPQIDAGTHGQGSVGSLAAVCCLLALAGVLDGLGQGALFGTAAALGPLVVEARSCTLS